MNLVIIIGPSAVGKRTVGMELSKLTGYNLLHNHQPKDLVIEMTGIFDVELLREIRKTIVGYYADNNMDGLILSFRYNYMSSGSLFHIRDLIEIVVTADNESSIYIVELNSSLDTRLDRNKTDDRLELNYVKPEYEILDSEQDGIYSSSDMLEHFDIVKNVLDIKNMYILNIDNNHISAAEAAEIIHSKILGTEK